MSGDNNKDKKEEMNHSEDEKSRAAINEQGEKAAMKNKLKSEEPEIIEKLPSKTKESIEAFMGSISGSFLSPLESKINEKHIDRILEIKEKYDDNAFKDTQQSRKYHLIYILIAAFFFVFLTLFLVGKDVEIFKEIIKLLAIFCGGFGTGYGIKTYKDKK
jgi:hypothetical protein